MLIAKTAQTIVDKIMSAINININNIMDEKALIIASGNKTRLGEFHAGAQKVIVTGKGHEVSPEQAEKMGNIKPGISLPIVFKDKVIGVVGMTGDPEKIRIFGELVKHSTELMLEQSCIDEEIFLEARAKKSFLLNLLLENGLDDESHVTMRAQLFNFLLDCPYALFAVDITAHSVKNSSSIISHERLMEYLCEQFGNKLSLYGKATACTVNNCIAILVPLRENLPSAKEAASIRNVIEIMRQMLAFLPQETVKIGFGGISRSWRQISRFFSNATCAIGMGKVYDNQNDVHFFEDYLCENVLTHIPPETGRQFYRSVLGDLLNKKTEPLETFISTLQIYFNFDMSVKDTAMSLHIHPNTLSFRLSKIKDATGYNPRDFNDAFRLRLALLLFMMDKNRSNKT